MDRASRGDLLLDCLPALRAYVRKIARDQQTAVELLQEVSVRILAGEGPDDRERFVAWCCGIARHVRAYDWRTRRRWRDELPLDLEAMERACPHLSDPESQLDARAWLSRVIVVLDQDGFELLVRRHVFDESATELAEELAQTPAAIRMRLMRLRSMVLRTCTCAPAPEGVMDIGC
jgi:RNA polymerase sigma factor (sigma-70 family)